MRHSRVVQVTATLFLWSAVYIPHLQAARPHPAPVGQVSYVYACDVWRPHQPPEARGLFDVSWLRERVGAEERRTIEEMGGVVLHEFNVCAVRARLWIARIPPMSHTASMRIESVESPHDYMVKVTIRMPLPRTAADREFLTSLGAIITEDRTNDVLARVPDEAIPTIRAHPRVQWIWAAGQFGCLD